MSIVIDMHHYAELYEIAKGDSQSLWPYGVVGWTYYRNFPQKLLFELVNEPAGEKTDDRWQEMYPKLLQSVRKTNPERMILIGPGNWNNLDPLQCLHLPDHNEKSDCNIPLLQSYVILPRGFLGSAVPINGKT